MDLSRSSVLRRRWKRLFRRWRVVWSAPRSCDRGRDPGPKGEGGRYLQPHRRGLRPGAVPGPRALLEGIARGAGGRARPTTPLRRRARAARGGGALLRARPRAQVPRRSVLITGGARPLSTAPTARCSTRATWSSIPVPSWNNNHYAYLCGARAVEMPVARRRQLLPHARGSCARTFRRRACCCLNSPAQPDRHGHRSARCCSGSASCVVEENRGAPARRARARPLWLCTTRSTGS